MNVEKKGASFMYVQIIWEAPKFGCLVVVCADKRMEGGRWDLQRVPRAVVIPAVAEDGLVRGPLCDGVERKKFADNFLASHCSSLWLHTLFWLLTFESGLIKSRGKGRGKMNTLIYHVPVILATQWPLTHWMFAICRRITSGEKRRKAVQSVEGARAGRL